MTNNQPKGMRKLTDGQARQIREDYDAGETVQSIAKRHSVSPNTIYRIIRGQTYQHEALDDECPREHEPLPREKSAHERIDELAERFECLSAWMSMAQEGQIDNSTEAFRRIKANAEAISVLQPDTEPMTRGEKVRFAIGALVLLGIVAVCFYFGTL